LTRVVLEGREIVVTIHHHFLQLGVPPGRALVEAAEGPIRLPAGLVAWVVLGSARGVRRAVGARRAAEDARGRAHVPARVRNPATLILRGSAICEAAALQALHVAGRIRRASRLTADARRILAVLRVLAARDIAAKPADLLASSLRVAEFVAVREVYGPPASCR
jgi:hypothetical protein